MVNSGLLEPVLEGYPDGVPRIHAAGSGRALEMLAQGTVPLVITHAPEAEERALALHSDWVYRKIAFNYFVIVGPPSDPAGIHDAPSAIEAFRRVAAHDAPFVSRGDESGTHERETALWREAGVEKGRERVLISGAGMATTLRQADARVAYTLSDESTWRQLEPSLKLRLLVADNVNLLNTYAVIYARDSPKAMALAEWLISGEGRQRIAAYRVANQPAFRVWPAQCAGTAPSAKPTCD